MRDTQNVCITLPRSTIELIDEAARAERRTRSNFIRTALERSLTAEDRMVALEAIAADGLAREANKSPRKPANITAIIANASRDGHERLAALQAVADANGENDA